MPIKKKLTLGLGLLVITSSALADNYKIKSGDTVEAIASRHHVSLKSLLAANGLKTNSVLKLGRNLVIPGSSDRSSSKNVSSSGGYVVRNGDMDWTIAKKNGMTVAQLKSMNPGVKWSALQIGTRLTLSKSSRSATVASKATSVKPVKAGGTYAIQSGDNDWIIAKRVGSTPKVIHQLNPSVNWDRIQPGQAIKVPGFAVASSKTSSSAKISSRFAVVTGDNVTIRRGPSTGKDAITTVGNGTKVTVLDRDGDWYKLRFPKGTEGWIRGDFLKATKTVAPSAVAKAAPKPKVTAKPVPKKLVAQHAPQDSNAGHMTQTIVATQKTGATVDKVLNKARSMRGVRYRWGAASRSATDCSGFTSQAFRSAGITLPRTSSEQASAGISVAKKDLKAGDLVFFQTVRGRRISHVGIYVGNGNFMHASSGGGHVMESSLNEGYYKERYVTARRMVKSKKSPKELVRSLPNLDDIQIPADAPAESEGAKPTESPNNPPLSSEK